MIQALQKYAILKDVIDQCDRVVADALKTNTLREAHVALESFNNGGKRLRPALLVLSSMVPRGTGFDDVEPGLIDLAGAVELVHLATLFHDDVIDEVDTRRTKLSARLKYGNYASVLTGDFALAEALELVQRSGYPEAMREFIRTLRVLIRGESVETSNKFNFELSEAEYYDIISEKSASLFALSCKVGALSQGAEFADTLGHFGWNLGMAFQMIDDLDDIVDDPAHTYDCDLRNGYLALPMIRAFAHLQDGNRERLVSIIRDGEFTPENERFVVSLCMELGTIEETNAEIRKHLTRAREALGRFSESRSRELLTHVVDDLAAYADRQVENFAVYLREHTA